MVGLLWYYFTYNYQNDRRSSLRVFSGPPTVISIASNSVQYHTERKDINRPRHIIYPYTGVSTARVGPRLPRTDALGGTLALVGHINKYKFDSGPPDNNKL